MANLIAAALSKKSHAPRIHTLMWSFQFWLLLREQLDRDAYNDLFRQELERLLSRLTDPIQRQHAESMLDFDWTRYMAGAVRRSLESPARTKSMRKSTRSRFACWFHRVDCSGITMNGDTDLSRLRFKRTLANMLKNLRKRRETEDDTSHPFPFVRGLNPVGSPRTIWLPEGRRKAIQDCSMSFGSWYSGTWARLPFAYLMRARKGLK